jgi:hypothetical protein
MRKDELIKRLQKIEGNPIIICSSDAEGNHFSLLEEVSYDEESYWNGSEFIDAAKLTKTQMMKRAVVLFPI